MFELTGEDWQNILNDPVGRKWAHTTFSTINATDLTTAIQAFVQLDEPAAFSVMKYLFNLREICMQVTKLYAMQEHETISAVTLNDDAIQKLHYKVGQMVKTAGAGGDFANEALLAALTGYYSIMILGKIKASANVAAGATLTFESPAATPASPSLFTLPALTAGEFSNCVEGVVVYNSSFTDNQAIVVDGANFGNATVVTLCYRYWYET